VGFTEVLGDLMTNVPGIVGTAVLAEDGLLLEARGIEGAPDIEVIGAELAVSYRNLFKGMEDIPAGEFEEFHARYGSLTYVVRRLTQEYFALVVISPEGLLGQARWQLRKAAERLAVEF
jgi:predicted regulator of Ras-like GTPase activity (Roadblock/LC7/MglB family)